MTPAPSASVDGPAPRTAAEHIARGLALWTVEQDGCGREELAMRLYRLAGGRLWVSTVEHARNLQGRKRRRQFL
ncbi:MAG: hypothetical protein K0Q60_5050 [Microvirga sp.]|nr:hypothetical protein [Microvirga sp.]